MDEQYGLGFDTALRDGGGGGGGGGTGPATGSGRARLKVSINLSSRVIIPVTFYET